jgi:hypothetical protein
MSREDEQANETGSVAAGEGPDTAASAGQGTTGPEASSPADRSVSEARGAELRAELAQTDARRAEEETAKAEQEVEEAEKAQREREKAEREARERAQRADEEAERARREADEAARTRTQAASASGGAVSGATVVSPGVGTDTEPAAVAAAEEPSMIARLLQPSTKPRSQQETWERPEVVAGGAFVATFLLARILGRLVN